MIEFYKSEIDKMKIPSAKGLFIFAEADKTLYIQITNNLEKSIRQLFQAMKADKNVFQLISQTDKISYELYNSLFEALIHKKMLENTDHPEFNEQIKSYESYVYLGIDLQKPPYFKVVENTQQNDFYLGPFKHRFFVFDLLDAMAGLFKFPLCPDKKPYPCKRYKNNLCDGWCIKNKLTTYQKVILSYIFREIELLVHAKAEQKKYYDDLYFNKAEKLKNLIRIVEKYDAYLKFLFITKNLNLEFQDENHQYKVSKGRIESVFYKKKEYDFSYVSIDYRENELLAFNKDELSERRIIYNHLIKKNDKIILDKIDKIFKKSQLKVRSVLT
ncbi:MAG: hypothetical protein K9N07_00470 [Candidatus Cloacimonetes bacterium]|nr:hypothetical protein [Candidatus Cloacimonadota bacterium]